jgi:2-keto-4-pentenoate hydratase/2-oxohepta-3-ene-1,7-dioic acid hydratase in catechol pathway
MKIVKVTRDGAVADAILEGEAVHIIGGWTKGNPEDVPFALSKRLAKGAAALLGEAVETVALADVRLAAPIDSLAKILCVGMNYRDHVSEIKLEVAENPTIFQRYTDSLVADQDEIWRPKTSVSFDFEGEIAIIIGKGGRHIPLESAMDHVGGYTCFMDGSVREYQRHSLTAGKNYYRSGSIGPWIVPAEAMTSEYPTLETRLNGAVVQSSSTELLIFDIPHIIEYCSRFTLLRPGDIIATGTPGGVGSRREPPLWMKAGDTIEVEIEGIGTLTNHVVDER